MNTLFNFKDRSVDIRTGVAEIMFLFLLDPMRQHPQLMAAFENDWKGELSYVLLVTLDSGLRDEASIRSFLQLIEHAKSSLTQVQDPIPGDFLRDLAKKRGVFEDLAFGTIDRFKIVEALNDLEKLVKG